MPNSLVVLMSFDVPGLGARAIADIDGANTLVDVVNRRFAEALKGMGRINKPLDVGTPLLATFPTATLAIKAGVRCLASLDEGVGKQGLAGGIALFAAELDPVGELPPWLEQGSLTLQRLASAGRLIATETVRYLCPPNFDAVGFDDFGWHHVEDAGIRRRLYRISHSDLPVALSIAESEPDNHNLPRLLTRFIGREAEIEEAVFRFVHSRLVTLAGSGGIGKSRLALRVAEELVSRHTDGCWLVDFSGIRRPKLVANHICDKLGLLIPSGSSAIDALTAHFRHREALLVLDNVEHLTSAVADVVLTLTQMAPDIAVLVASRKPLDVVGESVLRIKPLQVPYIGQVDADLLERSEAVKLFIDRAQLADPQFDPEPSEIISISEICRAVEGIPLSIELRAAMVSRMSIDEIIASKPKRVRRIRSRGTRFGSTDDAIAWSIGRLDDLDQRLINAASVCSGSFDANALGSIAGIPAPQEGIENLCQASLMLAHSNPGRYQILEMTRQFLVAGLKGEPLQRLRRHHAEHFHSKLVAMPLGGQSDPLVRAEITADIDNHRAAFKQMIADGKEEEAFEFVRKLHGYWHMRGQWSEGAAELADYIAGFRELNRNRVQAYVLQANFAAARGDTRRAAALFRTAKRIARKLGELHHLGSALANEATMLRYMGCREQSKRHFEEALDLLKDREAAWWSVRVNYAAVLAELNHPEADRAIDECIAYYPSHGWELANLLYSRAVKRYEASELDAAQVCFEEAYEAFDKADAVRGIYFSLRALSSIAAKTGQGHRAALLAGAAATTELRANPLPQQLQMFGHPSLMDEVKSSLGEQRFQYEFEMGRNMDRDHIGVFVRFKF